MSTKTQELMRARFWELDDKIEAVQQGKLKPLEDERNAMAVDEAILQRKIKANGKRRQQIIKSSGLQEMAKERSGCAGFLKGMTGVHP